MEKKLTPEERRVLHKAVENDVILNRIIGAYQAVDGKKGNEHKLHWDIVRQFQVRVRKHLATFDRWGNWNVLSPAELKTMKGVTKNDEAMSEIAIVYLSCSDILVEHATMLEDFKKLFIPKIKKL
jgi:hypothetical protein